MPPTLLIIRHAEALHNVASDWSLHDPPLSELGEQQCAELQESLKKEDIANKVELIVTSPMRRTLQTTKLALGFLTEGKKVPVMVDAGWQENADKPCDTGSPIPTITQQFPDFDYTTLDPTYPDKTTNLHSNPYAFTRRAILTRGQTCLKNLYSRPEKVIAVVSHSGFLRAGICQRRFFNADWRVFEFDEGRMKESKEKGEGIGAKGEFVVGTREGLFWLKEWEMTEERGGGMGRSDKGFCGPESVGFPAEVKEEETKEVPGKGN